MKTKLCRVCGEEKDLSLFVKGKNLCKVCDIARLEEWKSDKPLFAWYHTFKQNARRRHTLTSISYQEFVDWYDTLKTEDDIPTCFYCGRQLDFDNKHLLQGASIDRFDPTIGYTPNNMIMSCLRCNVIKGNWFDPMEMLEIAKKYFSDEVKIL